MNIPRLLANAVARRIAVIVVAAVLAWLGLGEARAQHGACPTGGNCTREQAWNACQVAIAADDVANTNPNTVFQCSTGAGATAIQGAYSSQSKTGGSWATYGSAFRWYSSCPTGQEWNSYLNQCKTTCSSRSPSIGSYSSMIPSGSVACIDGCEAMVTPVGEGTYLRTFIGGPGSQCGVIPNDCSQLAGYAFNAVTGMCQPPFAECEENEVKDPSTGVCEQGCPAGMILDGNGVCKPKEDDCPPGQVRAPSGECLPGEGQCAVGEVRRANGTCGRDSDGDGEADEDDDDPENDPDKEFFAGGDNCSSPPSCSGGPIDCGMARIQWRIDCNTRRSVNITGGACSAMPICVGDNCRAMEHAQLIQQWRAACALEKMAAGEEGEGPVGDANRNGVADVLEGRFTPSDGGEDGETTVRSIEVSASWLDQDNIFGGGSCPAPISFDLMGKSISSADFEHWCTAMSILRVLILVFGTWTAIQILLGRWL